VLDSVVDLRFPLFGGRPVGDISYPFFASVSACLGRHLPPHVLIGPLVFARTGPVGSGVVLFRLPAAEVGLLVGLAGKSISVGQQELIVGVPEVRPLKPADQLRSRLIVFKPSGERSRPWLDDPGEFLGLASGSLERKGIAAGVQVPARRWGPHAGRPTRRVVTIKGVRVPGFALEVSGLTPEDSVRLQAEGLGGRLHFGCGFFVPVVKERRTRLAP
jgi:CRISPR-associated protein Cas6